jgi:hypothetical protein
VNDLQRNYAACLEALRLLHRPITDAEQLEAAKALGLESWLAEPVQPSLIKEEAK